MMPKLTTTQRNLLIIIVAGLVVRYVLGILLTYPRDIASWILNSENFLMGEGLYGLPGHYYTPVWGYVMAVVTAFCGFLGIPISQYYEGYTGGSAVVPWEVVLPTMEYSLIVKTLLFVVDLLVAYVLYKIVMHVRSDERLATIAFGIWFLCPLVIIISSVRVMFENLEILLMLLSLLMILYRKPALAGVMMGMSILVKPYGIFLGIILIGYAFAQTQSLRYVGRYVLWTVLAMLAMMLPVVATGGLDDAMIWLTARSGNISSGYNVSLMLIPALIAISALVAFLLARNRCTDFGILICASMAVTAGTLVFAGNVQYYQMVIPFAVLLMSRLSILVLVPILAMSVFAGLSYLEWSSELYIQGGYWGSSLLEGIDRIELSYNYDQLKSLTGCVAAIVPVALLLNRRYHVTEG